jgi:hypothetical protein
MKKISVLLAMIVLLTSCMSGKQRYKLQDALIKAQAQQARTYSPLVMHGKVTIQASEGMTVMVPLEQTEFTPIPNDYETTIDFAKFFTGVGGAYLGVKELNKTRTTKTVNNYAEPKTP